MVVLAGVNPMANFLQGQADYFSTLGLPGWLVQWVSEAASGSGTDGSGRGCNHEGLSLTGYHARAVHCLHMPLLHCAKECMDASAV